MTIFNVLTLIGGLAFFLYGMNVMGDGLKKLSGGKFESILSKMTSNKAKAIMVGALVTAVMQSSSATTVMIVGFVNSGLMELSKCVSLIFGANIGATITPWVMSLSSIGAGSSSMLLKFLKPTSFAPILAIIGVGNIMLSKKDKNRNIALILIGFAVLMFGMETMSGAVSPLADSPEFTSVMTMFANNPFLAMLIAVALTGIIQSSSATIGMVQVLSTSGLITYGAALPLLLGANIGTCATALLSSIGTSRNARRSALIHFFYNVIRSLLVMVVFYTINRFVHFAFLNVNATAVGIAVIDTTLSITLAIILAPFSKMLEKLTYLVLPVTEEEQELQGMAAKRNITLLDERFLESPGLAVEQCRRVAIGMATYARDALFLSIDLLNEFKEKKAKRVSDLEDIVDHYEDILGSYIVKLSTKSMNPKDSQDISMILHGIGDWERISDHACNIVDIAREMQEKELVFSKKAQEEVRIFTEAVKETVDCAYEAFSFLDMEKASAVGPLEEVIDKLTNTIKKRHIKRLRKGKCSIEMGFVLSDLSTNYERVSDHCSNIALSVLHPDDDMGSHEYEEMNMNKNNEEFIRRVKVYEEKYALPKKSEVNLNE